MLVDKPILCHRHKLSRRMSDRQLGILFLIKSLATGQTTADPVYRQRGPDTVAAVRMLSSSAFLQAAVL